MDAAILTMIAALLVAVLASAHDQRRVAVKTGEKLNDLNSKYERLEAGLEILNTKFDEHKRTTEKNHEQLRDDLADHKRTTEKHHEQLRDDVGEHKRTTEKHHGHLRDDVGEHKRTAEKHHEQLRNDLAEHKRITEKNHDEVTGSLSDARERLARIEGHLRIGFSPPAPPELGQ